MITRSEIKALLTSYGPLGDYPTIVLWEIHHWDGLESGDYIRAAISVETATGYNSLYARPCGNEYWIPVAFSVWPLSIEAAINELMEDLDFNVSMDIDPIVDLLPDSEQLLYA